MFLEKVMNAISTFLSIAVSPETTILPTSVNQTFAEGADNMLECSSEGGPNNTYQWRFNDTDIDGATLPVLMLTNVTASSGGIYTCVASNVAGSDSASTFLYISPYFITEPMDTQTSNEASASLMCEAGAFPSPEYQWGRVDEELIRYEITTNTRILTFNPVMFGDEGGYYCTASSLGVTIQSLDAILSGKFLVIVS